MRKVLTHGLPLAGAMVCAAAVWAQNSGLTRTIVGRGEVSVGADLVLRMTAQAGAGHHPLTGPNSTLRTAPTP